MRPKLRIPAPDKTSIPNSYPARTVKKVATCYLRIISDREAVGPISVFTRHKMVQVENLSSTADLKRLQVAENVEVSDLAIRSNAHLGA